MNDMMSRTRCQAAIDDAVADYGLEDVLRSVAMAAAGTPGLRPRPELGAELARLADQLVKEKTA